MPNILQKEIEVDRWFIRDEFNFASPKQIREYMLAKGHTARPAKGSKTGLPSTNEQTLIRLAKKDPVFRKILDMRELQKMDSTYATGLLGRIAKDGRIHTKFLHKPYTMRLSSVDPNLQNLPGEDDDPESLHSQFRRCIVADTDCWLVSMDFASIEAIETGWWSGDEAYFNLAKHGIHSYLVSHKVGKPADPTWDEKKLGEYLKEIKAEYKNSSIYAALKKTVHTTNYGGTEYQLHSASPDLFPTLASAIAMQEYYYELCPGLKAWHDGVRVTADKQCYLGGPSHPFKYKAWFWDVTAWDTRYRKFGKGSDWNKVIAFYPQSSSAGVLYDACLRMMDPTGPWYVGNLYHDQTPIRALIHDEVVFEVPKKNAAKLIELATMAMKEPVTKQMLPWDTKTPLKFDVDVRVGPSWGEMEKA